MARAAAPLLGLLTAVLTPEVLAQEARTPPAKGSLSAIFESTDVARRGWIIPIRVNQGEPHGVQVDTGSLGLAFPMARIGGTARPAPQEELPKPTPSNCITYSSSHLTLVGQWVMAPVSFPNALTTDSMPVLGVTASCLPKEHDARGKNKAKVVSTQAARTLCSEVPADATCREWGGGMMGVGIERGTPVVPPQYNALRQLSSTLARTHPGVAQGYIVHSDSVEVGLTEDNTRSFQWVQLSPADDTSPQWPDWHAVPGCFRLGAGENTWTSSVGTVLVDTGLTTMYVSAPTLPSKSLQSTEVPITVMVPCGGASPVLSQVFMRPEAQEKGDAVVPGLVRLFEKQRPPFVNTGRNLLQTWDYAYDAQKGRVGFRAHAP